MVLCRDWPKLALYSEQIFFRSTSQRDTMILVTSFSLAPLDWRGESLRVELEMLGTKARAADATRRQEDSGQTLDSVSAAKRHFFQVSGYVREVEQNLYLPSWLRSVFWQSTAVCFQSTEL